MRTIVALVLLGSCLTFLPVLAAEPEPGQGVAALVQLLTTLDEPEIQRDILAGMRDALRGRRMVPMPAAWPKARENLVASPHPQVRTYARELAVLFGDPEALEELQQILQDSGQPAEQRRAALSALLQRRPEKLADIVVKLLDDPHVRAQAIRALAEFQREDTPELLLKRYPGLTAAEKEDVVFTLSARLAWARELVKALSAGRIPRQDLSAFTVRQLLAFQDQNLSRELTAAWGALRPASEERGALIARYKALLTPEFVAMADPDHGRAVFARNCGGCHVLFNEGAKIGPELTGAQRTNLDYVLENLVDPNALVGRDYQVTIVATADGRTIHGFIRQETPHALVLQTPNEVVTVPKDEIEERKQSAVSLMPEGLLSKLSDEEIRDLVAHLAR